MRHRRVWRLFFAGMIAAIAIGLAAFVAFTRTQGGRTRVLNYTLSAVGGRLNGYLDVEDLDGNLVTGAKLYAVSLLDADSAVIVRADSAFANYELPSFFGGDVVLNQLVLYGADVSLRKFPGDSLWNYQEVLLDTTQAPGGAARATILRDVRLVDARITVRMPWEPDSTASAAAQAIEVRDALADSSRIEVARHPAGGFLRTMRFEVDDAQLSDIVISGEERGGTYVRLESASARAQLYRGEPLVVREAEGGLAMDRGVMRFRFPAVALPGSRIAASGMVDMREPVPRYDLAVAADSADLGDMLWIYPRLPANGRASFEMKMETRDEGTLFRFDTLRFSAPGTRLVGSFGVVLGETLLFTDVNLTAQPLRMETIEAMLPQELPVQGLHIGAVEVRSSGRGSAAAPPRPAGTVPRPRA